MLSAKEKIESCFEVYKIAELIYYAEYYSIVSPSLSLAYDALVLSHILGISSEYDVHYLSYF